LKPEPVRFEEDRKDGENEEAKKKRNYLERLFHV
jgi:hypothetical protein